MALKLSLRFLLFLIAYNQTLSTLQKWGYSKSEIHWLALPSMLLMSMAPFHSLWFIVGVGYMTWICAKEKYSWLRMSDVLLTNILLVYASEKWIFLFGFLFITYLVRKKYEQEGTCAWIALLMYGCMPWTAFSIVWILISGVGLVTKRHHTKPTVLFDLDGTLIDSQPLVFETFRRVFQEKLPEHELTHEELCSFFGPTLEVTFKKYFKESEIESVIERYQEINLELHEAYLKNMPEAIETIQALKAYGCQVGIVSNKRHKPVELGLEISGLKPYMDVVLGTEDLPKPKPDASGLLKACDLLHANYDTCIYVGDNPSDILAAKNMAAYSIGYSNDAKQIENLRKAQPCRQVSSLLDIVDICKEDRMWRDFSIW